MRLVRPGTKAGALVIAVLSWCGCSRKSPDSPKRIANSGADQSTHVTSVPGSTESPNINPGDPASILAAVRQNIQSDFRIKSKQIEVSFDHGTIRLKGRVGSDDEVYAAGKDALNVEGVRGVANYLSAETFEGTTARPLPPGYEARIDSVQQAIQSDSRVKGKIQVSFMPPDPQKGGPGGGRDGTLHLGGSVENDDDLIAAENDARKTTDLPFFTGIGVLHDPTQSSLMEPPPQPWSGPSQPDQPRIPLCQGLTVVTAIAGPDGDYESIKTIESVAPKEVRLKYSAEVMPAWWETAHPALQKTETHRTILTTDLESAHSYDQIFVTGSNVPEAAPGTTAIGTSAAVLRELKTKGESELSLCGGSGAAQIRGTDGELRSAPGGCFNFTNSFRIQRLENEPVRLHVLVNGTPVDLPAIHALGKWGGDKRNEFFFLDDERNPLTLKFRLGIGGVVALRPGDREFCRNVRTKGNYGPFLGDEPRSCDLPDGGDIDSLRVVKITTDCSIPGTKSESATVPANAINALEQSLLQTGKVDIYSVYFSFNSDAIRNESQPTLREIAEVLMRHRDWKLRIAGHTDGIGGDEQNLDLSKRRAAAVKDALVKKYGIAAARLETTGFGKSQPKDTNGTLEGRAHNRRVELMKIP